MEEPLQTPVQPPVVPINQPVQPMAPTPKWPFRLWLFAAVGAAVLLVAAIAFSIQMVQTLSRAPAPASPSPIPTPTISRRLSAIATDSAFLLLESSVGSLSARVSSLSSQDTTLTPPVLTLPLGFQQ